MITTDIIVTTPLESRLYGVELDGYDWEQSATPTHLAMLDEVALVAGTYSGVVYEDTDEVASPDYEADFKLEFFAFLDGVLSGTL